MVQGGGLLCTDRQRPGSRPLNGDAPPLLPRTDGQLQDGGVEFLAARTSAGDSPHRLRRSGRRRQNRMGAAPPPHGGVRRSRYRTQTLRLRRVDADAQRPRNGRQLSGKGAQFAGCEIRLQQTFVARILLPLRLQDQRRTGFRRLPHGRLHLLRTRKPPHHRPGIRLQVLIRTSGTRTKRETVRKACRRRRSPASGTLFGPCSRGCKGRSPIPSCVRGNNAAI